MNELIATLVMTHITIVCVTLYLHRSQAHRSIEFHPVISHLMRAWLWLTTGMVTQQWVAIHRKHHRFSDQLGDPHSPHVFGLWRVFLGGAWLYNTASQDSDMIKQYGSGSPNDWIERHVYSRAPWAGILLLLIAELVIFGWPALIVWGIQMIWIPFWAAGVINGIGHWWGYRNGSTKDNSRNISPLGIIIGGEELHNNHHLNPASARLSRRWFEFDVGWLYARLLSSVGLAKIRTA